MPKPDRNVLNNSNFPDFTWSHIMNSNLNKVGFHLCVFRNTVVLSNYCHIMNCVLRKYHTYFSFTPWYYIYPYLFTTVNNSILCLCNETFIKTQKQTVQRAFRLVNMWRCYESTWRCHESTVFFSHTLPYASFSSGCSWALIFYDKLII